MSNEQAKVSEPQARVVEIQLNDQYLKLVECPLCLALAMADKFTEHVLICSLRAMS